MCRGGGVFVLYPLESNFYQISHLQTQKCNSCQYILKRNPTSETPHERSTERYLFFCCELPIPHSADTTYPEPQYLTLLPRLPKHQQYSPKCHEANIDRSKAEGKLGVLGDIQGWQAHNTSMAASCISCKA